MTTALSTSLVPSSAAAASQIAADRRTRRVARLYAGLWLGELKRVGGPIPEGCLVLAAHYNGLVDGFTYGSQMPPFAAVLSAQWHRSVLGRMLLPGIPVQRAKDGVRGAANLQAFRSIVAALKSGRRVLFFPEGTSRLGEARLPVQPGTLLLLRQLRKHVPAIRVVFAAAQYPDPTRWRSPAAVAFSSPTELPPDEENDEEWIRTGLLSAQASAARVEFPARSRAMRAAACVVAFPFLPVWALAARLASGAADDSNVVALWKFLLGVPLTVVALAACAGVAQTVCAAPGLAVLSLFGGWWLWKR